MVKIFYLQILCTCYTVRECMSSHAIMRIHLLNFKVIYFCCTDTSIDFTDASIEL